MSEPEAYIPSARDATVAYAGWTPDRRYRCYCVRCHDDTPLTDAARVYGDLYVAEPSPLGSVDDGERCDRCDVALLDLSRQCQADHDAQQARFARQPVHALVEYGIPAAIRCRVY